jgi:hypothetical protein
MFQITHHSFSNCAKGSTSQDRSALLLCWQNSVLGCGIPEVLSMLFLMSRVKSGTNSRSRRIDSARSASSDTWSIHSSGSGRDSSFFLWCCSNIEPLVSDWTWTVTNHDRPRPQQLVGNPMIWRVCVLFSVWFKLAWQVFGALGRSHTGWKLLSCSRGECSWYELDLSSLDTSPSYYPCNYCGLYVSYSIFFYSSLRSWPCRIRERSLFDLHRWAMARIGALGLRWK